MPEPGSWAVRSTGLGQGEDTARGPSWPMDVQPPCSPSVSWAQNGVQGRAHTQQPAAPVLPSHLLVPKQGREAHTAAPAALVPHC